MTHPTPKDWREYNMPVREIDGEEWIRRIDHKTLLSHAQEEERARIVGRIEKLKENYPVDASLTTKEHEIRINWANPVAQQALDQVIDIVKDSSQP
jgi:hemerythrin superfamily protein